MHTDMERQFTLYEISTPYGRNYIGITSQPLQERLRQRKAMTEKARAARLAKYGHGGRGE